MLYIVNLYIELLNFYSNAAFYEPSIRGAKALKGIVLIYSYL